MTFTNDLTGASISSNHEEENKSIIDCSLCNKRLESCFALSILTFVPCCIITSCVLFVVQDVAADVLHNFTKSTALQ